MNKKKLKLKDHGISKSRYMELRGFCGQYPEWKQEIGNHAYISSVTYKTTPGNPNKGTTDMTGNTAIKLERFQRNIDLIETIAKRVDDVYWKAIIDMVCYDMSPAYCIAINELPLSQSVLYERRRYFFYLLDIEKCKIP